MCEIGGQVVVQAFGEEMQSRASSDCLGIRIPITMGVIIAQPHRLLVFIEFPDGVLRPCLISHLLFGPACPCRAGPHSLSPILSQCAPACARTLDPNPRQTT